MARLLRTSANPTLSGLHVSFKTDLIGRVIFKVIATEPGAARSIGISRWLPHLLTASEANEASHAAKLLDKDDLLISACCPWSSGEIPNYRTLEHGPHSNWYHSATGNFCQLGRRPLRGYGNSLRIFWGHVLLDVCLTRAGSRYASQRHTFTRNNFGFSRTEITSLTQPRNLASSSLDPSVSSIFAFISFSSKLQEMSRPSREGLVWQKRGLGDKSRWKTHPKVEAIRAVCLRVLNLASEKDCIVQLFAAGSFNRLYSVEVPGQEKLLMRVSLPVDPHNKILGEVATVRWLRRFTSVPVPEIIAFDASSDNEIGFEWILMSFIAGTSAYSLWRKIPMITKEGLVRQVAKFQAQILEASEAKSPLRGIGTLTYASGEVDGLKEDANPVPGQIVSRHFFIGKHFDYDVPRGPFPSSREWIDSYLAIIILEQEEGLGMTEDDEEKEDIEYHITIAKKLQGLLPIIFQSAEDLPERTAPWHEDLSLKNMLIDEDGTITAILDWEFVSAMPYWLATESPQFLQGLTREKEPVRDEYGDETREEAEDREFMGDAPDNEGKNELYWHHLMEYEQTRLRTVYAGRMRELRPNWDAEVTDGVLKSDFLGAVEQCGGGWPLRAIERWINAVEKGEFPRLHDVLEPGV